MQLIINTGSTSKKYALFHNDEMVLGMRFESDSGLYKLTIKSAEKELESESEISETKYKNSLSELLDKIKKSKIISKIDDVDAVGIRIVAPGIDFTEHKIIDREYIDELWEVLPYAPLHIAPLLAEMNALNEIMPEVTIVAISDSAFHRTISDAARLYSIKLEDSKKFEVERFGYHGLSMESVVSKFDGDEYGDVPDKMIACHLGGGSSVTALKDGKSIDTSMGFTPVGGLHMSTRTGDIDSGAVMYLAEKKKMKLDDLRIYFNTECGMNGVAGVSDMREVLKLQEEGDKNAQLALEMYILRIKKYIGSYIVVLGGLDTLVLTAAIAERNAYMRSIICSDLEHMGIILDDKKNESLNNDGYIHAEDSKIKILVLSTNEVGVMKSVLDRIVK